MLFRMELSETDAAIMAPLWVLLGAGTARGPITNEAALPRYETSEATAVAVALWSGANQVVERKGPALIMVGPAKPFRNWPPCINLEQKQKKQKVSIMGLF